MTGSRRAGEAGGGDDVRRYLDEVGAHELLTAAEEVALGRRMAAGRSAAVRLAAGEATAA